MMLSLRVSGATGNIPGMRRTRKKIGIVRQDLSRFLIMWVELCPLSQASHTRTLPLPGMWRSPVLRASSLLSDHPLQPYTGKRRILPRM